MKTVKKAKGISRIDQDARHTHGWYVRIQKSGRSVSKFFSDDLLGGKQKALNLAIEFRESLAKKRELPAKLSVAVVAKPKARAKKATPARRPAASKAKPAARPAAAKKKATPATTGRRRTV